MDGGRVLTSDMGNGWSRVRLGRVGQTAVGGEMVILEGCAVGEVEVDDGGRGKRRNQGNLG